jgi:hypothetical protein
MKIIILSLIVSLLSCVGCNRESHVSNIENKANSKDISVPVTGTPQWIEEKSDPETWLSANELLKVELAPDDEKKLPAHQAASLYKYIAKIMKIDSYALVIVGKAMDKSYAREADYFKAYTVNLKAKNISIVSEKGFVLWGFDKWVNFDHSSVPDTVIHFESCEGCESTSFLASFQFDSTNNHWKMRTWPEDGKLESNVLIGDYWHGDDDDYYTTCMYSLNDFNNDGVSDIATYCRTKGASKGWQPAVALLRTVTSSGPITQKLEGVAASKLRQTLCKEHFEKNLCK